MTINITILFKAHSITFNHNATTTDNNSYETTISYNPNNHIEMHQQLLLLTLASSQETYLSSQRDAYNDD